MFRVISLIIALLASSLSNAKGVYLTRDAFLQAAFERQEPRLERYWLSDADRATVEKILHRKLEGLRLPYWSRGSKTAWVFDEIGKTEPITIGVVIDADQIQQIHILEFRETRGWEVKYPFFRNQFIGAHLLPDQALSKNIDGITGATLSVNAVKKIAILALYFHQQVFSNKPVELANEQ